MFPRPEGYIPDRYMERKNFMNYPGLVELACNRNRRSIWDIDGIKEALPALEAQRKRDFEDWMDEHGIDLVAFPANGDVGKADLDNNDESARHALQIGVKYSNGNRAIRVSPHLRKSRYWPTILISDTTHSIWEYRQYQSAWVSCQAPICQSI